MQANRIREHDLRSPNRTWVRRGFLGKGGTEVKTFSPWFSGRQVHHGVHRRGSG
jgi:hypothetical protein